MLRYLSATDPRRRLIHGLVKEQWPSTLKFSSGEVHQQQTKSEERWRHGRLHTTAGETRTGSFDSPLDGFLREIPCKDQQPQRAGPSRCTSRRRSSLTSWKRCNQTVPAMIGPPTCWTTGRRVRRTAKCEDFTSGAPSM